MSPLSMPHPGECHSIPGANFPDSDRLGYALLLDAYGHVAQALRSSQAVTAQAVSETIPAR